VLAVAGYRRIPASADVTRTRSAGTLTIAAGAVAGIAWAAGLRAYMAELAGSASVVTWTGTFGAVLLPGAVTGAAFAWAEFLRRTGNHRHRPWLATAPVLFAVAPLLLPHAAATLVSTGEGSGAMAVPIVAITGGYALSGRGRLRIRLLSGVISGSLVTAVALATPVFAQNRLTLTEPRGAWIAIFVATLLAVVATACAIPLRADSRRSGGTSMSRAIL
jgi:hypothetical protein